ncbi:MAG: hypothetical protein WDN00_12220 [Limisphaerales bacterium]
MSAVKSKFAGLLRGLLRHFDDEPEVAKTFEPAVPVAPPVSDVSSDLPEPAPVSSVSETPVPPAPGFDSGTCARRVA